jgi:hypothetical protein
LFSVLQWQPELHNVLWRRRLHYALGISRLLRAANPWIAWRLFAYTKAVHTALIFVLLLGACSLSFDPAELACPCAVGFRCDTSQNVCVEGAVADGGVDTSVDAESQDAGPPSICETATTLVCEDFEGEPVLTYAIFPGNEFTVVDGGAYRGRASLNAEQGTPGEEFRASAEIDSSSSDLWVRFAYDGEPDGAFHSLVSVAVSDSVNGTGRFYLTVSGAPFAGLDLFAIRSAFPVDDETESDVVMVPTDLDWQCMELHIHEGDAGSAYVEFFIQGAMVTSLRDQSFAVDWNSAAIDLSFGVGQENVDYLYDDFVVSESRVPCR